LPQPLERAPTRALLQAPFTGKLLGRIGCPPRISYKKGKSREAVASMRAFIDAKGRQARKGRVAILGLAALLMLACSKSPEGAAPAAGQGLKIAAAAELTNAFEEVGREYERVHQAKVTFISGSSGLLAKQISQGAP
jgi:molybdate transport system substrate-binding protein